MAGRPTLKGRLKKFLLNRKEMIKGGILDFQEERKKM